jgi:hypothetical protein
MALQQLIETQGVSYADTPFGTIKRGNEPISFLAYISIASIFGTKNEILVSVNFKSSLNQFSKDYKIPVSVEQNSDNFIKQAYNYLKTLPEFAGATDC